MTEEKKKAKELIIFYYNFVSGWTSTNRPDENPSAQYEGEEMKMGRAIQCALYCCNEILKAIPMYTGNLNPTWKFWNAVKAELTNETEPNP